MGVCAGFLAMPQAAHASESRHCLDPNTGKKKWMKVWRIHQMYKDTPEILENEGIHILDLDPEVWETRKALEVAWTERDWCTVYVLMLDVDRALARVSLDSEYSMSKFRRIERWLREGDFSIVQRKQAQNYLKTGAKALARGQLEDTNQVFNKALNLMFSLETPFSLPAELPTVDTGSSGAASSYDESDISEGCPELEGDITQTSYLAVVERLRRKMDSKLIRPIDLGDSAGMVADFSNYRKLDAIAPATKVACALLTRIVAVEINLSSVMKRFREISQRSRATAMPEFRRLKFKELVRKASDSLSSREFEAAHASLDDLLVLFGEPKLPSDHLVN